MILIQMAGFYHVEIGEILDGERKGENMNQQTEETLLKISDYNNNEKEFFTKRIRLVLIVGLVCMLIYLAIDIVGLSSTPPYNFISDFALGFVLGVLLTGTLYSTRYGAKIRAAKMRLLKRDKA